MSINSILNQLQGGDLSIAEAEAQIREHYFSDLGHTVVDNHREQRTGSAEVIYAAGKTPEQIAEIFSHMYGSIGILFAVHRRAVCASMQSAVQVLRSHQQHHTLLFLKRNPDWDHSKLEPAGVIDI